MKLFLFGLCFLSSNLHAQFLSVKVSAANWGIRDFSGIRYGQVSVLHEPAGDRLMVYTLRDGLPKVPRISTASLRPDFSNGCFVVSHFDGGMRNSLGGSFNVFQRDPSSAFVQYATALDGRQSLQLSYTKKTDGFCGLWLHLFNTSAPGEERKYLDASEFSYIVCWVRGLTGKERFLVKIADAAFERKEDALQIGELGSFLPSGKIDTLWQRAVIPISRIPLRIVKSQLATLSFEASEQQQGVVQFKTLAFCRDTTSFPQLSPAISGAKTLKFKKAVWVWNTDDLFRLREGKSELFELLANESVSDVFLAVPYRAGGPRHRGIEIDVKAMRLLVSDLKKKSVVVHALLGDKDFILSEQRPFVTATLENILRYNATSKKQERFDGIHFDVEPYLLPGFNGPRAGWILENFLDLLGNAASIAQRGNMVIGADIPFWLDTPDEFSLQPRVLQYQGVTKSVHEHIIDLMDIVVLMSYRTFAAGADGIVLHSSDELEYASRRGKHIFVGLETSPLPDENLLSFRGIPSEGSSGVASPRYFALVPWLDSAKVFVVKDPEKTNFEKFLTDAGVNSAQVLWWPVYQDIFVPGSKVSFTTLDVARFQTTIIQTASELSQFSAFQGVAIHHAESYLQLLRRR